MNLTDLAKRLDEAAVNREPTEQLGELSLVDAYAVQQALVDRQLARGAEPAGIKLGFTSQAKAAQMGVSDVIAGRLTSAMRLGTDIDPARYIHPRVEPELAFRLEPGGLAVALALEVIDSRYRDFRFSLTDVVADNASAAGFVVGPWTDIDELNHRAVTLLVDGRVVQEGSTRAILGDPLRSVTAAARLAEQYGIPLPPGSILLAGAATAAVPLVAGTKVTVTADGFDPLEVTVGG